MQPEHKHVVSVLNGLIETTIDTLQGYRRAAQRATDPRTRSLFAAQRRRRDALVRQLQQEVRSFGCEPRHEQSELGRLHRKFVDLEDLLSHVGDRGMLDELDRFEREIQARFEDAACDDALPAPVRALVGAAYVKVKVEHDAIQRIKRQMH